MTTTREKRDLDTSDHIAAAIVGVLFVLVVGGMTYLITPRATTHATVQQAAHAIP
jgi:hypothetical protein